YRGPTRSAPPGSRQAIEPPPAPTVWMSTIGSASGRPATSRDAVSRTAPPSTTHTSHDVPPMSKQTRSGRPVRAAMSAAAAAPPAVGAAALRRCEASLRRRQGWRMRGAQPVEVAARLPAELDDVGEAVGRDERGARGVALEQRVGGDGHPVRELGDVARRATRALERGVYRGHHALRLIG